MQKPVDEAEILRKNPKVDPNLVRRHRQLDEELQRLGVDTRPKYRLVPPLGDTVQRLFQQAPSPSPERQPARRRLR